MMGRVNPMKPENLQRVIQLRHELHQHPEVSLQESWTKQHLIDFLRQNTKLEIVDRGFWFYAVYHAGPDRKNVAFRADFDALPMPEGIDLPYASRCPGVAHKCGHDGHAAVLAGLALEIDQQGAEQNIFLLFQPAEEIGAGGEPCSAMIREHKIDGIYAFHNMSGMPFGSVNVIDNTAHCASRGMTIHLQGIPSHASQPEAGRNPAAAIAAIILAIPELTAPEKQQGLVLCTVIQVELGEKAFGISASQGDLRLTLRAERETELERLQQNLEKLAAALALRDGLTVAISYQDIFPETFNHKESVDQIRRAAKANGLEVNELTKAQRGSEDFGYYTKLTKGAICYLGNGEDYPPVHTFAYDFRDELLEIAVTLFLGLTK